MIIDTDVLIWYMRGDKNAYQVIESQTGFSMSVVTYMELVQGMRNRQEFKALQDAMKIWNAKMLFINEGISLRAMIYTEKYFLSH
jgi:predicted nucleic acid-binding protein